MRPKNPQSLVAGAALAALLSAAIGVVAQSTPSRSLLALSKRNHTLGIVDPNTLQVIARAAVGPDPHEVIASSDGKTAYVSIYGGGRYHALSVIDLVGQRALPDIDTGALNGPHGLAFVGGKVWFTAEGAKAVATYDPVSAKIDWIMGTGQNRTHMLYVTPRSRSTQPTLAPRRSASWRRSLFRRWDLLRECGCLRAPCLLHREGINRAWIGMRPSFWLAKATKVLT